MNTGVYARESFSYHQESRVNSTLRRRQRTIDASVPPPSIAPTEETVSSLRDRQHSTIGRIQQIAVLQQIASDLANDNTTTDGGSDASDNEDIDLHWRVDENSDQEDRLLLTSTASSGSVPRLSFLDPSLLSDVHNPDNGDCDDSSSSYYDDEPDDDVRPFGFGRRRELGEGDNRRRQQSSIYEDADSSEEEAPIVRHGSSFFGTRDGRDFSFPTVTVSPDRWLARPHLSLSEETMAS